MNEQDRILALEKQVWRMKLAVLAVIVLMFVSLIGQRRADEPSETIIARRIAVVDDQGQERAVLATRPDGGELVLHDAQGGKRLVLDVTASGPGLTFFERDGQVRVLLMLGQQGPRFSLTDPTGAEIYVAPPLEPPAEGA